MENPFELPPFLFAQWLNDAVHSYPDKSGLVASEMVDKTCDWCFNRHQSLMARTKQPAPVAISKALPAPKDCSDNCCWFGRSRHVDHAAFWEWSYRDRTEAINRGDWSHWLPSVVTHLPTGVIACS